MTFSLASKGATFKRFAKYSSNEQITLQGFPTATLPEGISCVTVEPAPINTIISYIYSFKYCHICPKIDIVPYRYSTA